MRHRKIENSAALLGGALLGAAAMYLLDPDQGRKRRATLKSQAGEYVGTAGEALQTGFEKVSEHARDVGQTIAEKAETYGQRLSDLAHEYREQLSEHANDVRKDVGSWSDSVKGAASQVNESIAGLRDQGSKLWGRYTGKAQSSAADAANNITDYGNEMWEQVRGLGRKVQKRVSAHMPEEHSSKVLPVTATALGCCAIGAGMVYLLDPKRGSSRRAWLKDGITNALHQTGKAFYRSGKDVANRTRGGIYDARLNFASGGPVASETLHDRVRSEVARMVADPGRIQLIADASGTVTLTGEILASESDGLLLAIESVPGVILVINRLDIVGTESGSKSEHNSPSHSSPNT